MTWDQRRTPLPPRRATPRRQRRDDTPDAKVHPVTDWQDTRVILWERSGGRCELCRKPFSSPGFMEGHHRQKRRRGIHCPCNALALCRDCHHGPLVHGNTDGTAAALGRMVSMHEDDPGAVPVLLNDTEGWTVLDCEGMYGFPPEGWEPPQTA